MKCITGCFVFITLCHLCSFAQSGSLQTDISANNWKLWLDRDAEWKDDKLYAPPVDLHQLPVHAPSIGWQNLEKVEGVAVHLPATVEQFYWGQNGNSFGVSGNYLGVSWFTTTLQVPAAYKNKHIFLHFESVRFRAEVFVNTKLMGYDLVNSTPFDVDITEAVQPGKDNKIAVRITDPDGNFDWRDSQNFMWGNYRVNPTHGFGGITGKVTLIARDAIYISDVFVKNKPVFHEADVDVTVNNQTAHAVAGTLSLTVYERGSHNAVYKKSIRSDQPSGEGHKIIPVSLKNAKLWSVDAPNLYDMIVEWKGDEIIDLYKKRFGFRWFEVKDIKGDREFFLNGKRIVLRTAISWGFWPVNGIAPSDALARKQIEDAKKLGLNMLNFHRTIGQQNVLDDADELGLLYFEEPGGNQFPLNLFYATDSLSSMQRDFYFASRNEKLFRMIRRDRSHPSLVIYNMHNERGAEPQQVDKEEMRSGHSLDETRIMTYNSSNGPIKQGPDPRFKLHLRPYDSTFYDYGWFDQHHAGGPGTYHNNLYNGPGDYLRYTDKKDEIVYYGEEGAIGTPPRLQLIRDEIMKTGKNIGWETDSYLKWYEAYDMFLKNNGFSEAYPNVDSLTRKMGNVAYYYQGRAIENVRINNTIDGYAVNGWEGMKLENHSGIVDNYRNLKGDPELIAKYNRPLYVAVKLNRKVLATGDTTVADFYIVNEQNLKGNFSLDIAGEDSSGKQLFSRSMPVKLTGGNTYGQLLYAGLPIVAASEGYTTIRAELKQGGKVLTTGDDDFYAVQLDTTNIPGEFMVADTTGILTSFLKSAGQHSFKAYRSGRPEGNCLLVGAFQPQQTGNPLVTDILEWVNDGNTLVIVNNSEAWAAHLAQKEVIDYRGSKQLGTSWYGGNYFSKRHVLFTGLPQAQVFNWEYQCFATYNRNRTGLRLFTGEPVVACVSDHKKEVYTALSIIPHGRGRIILCALDIYSCLKDLKAEKKAEGDGENAAMNTFNASQSNKANVVGQRLLLNMLRYGRN